jgi:surface polysaccharide O-acyltransferase-like enzyme
MCLIGRCEFLPNQERITLTLISEKSQNGRCVMQQGKKFNQERGFSIPVDLIRTIAIVGVILLHAARDLTIQQMGQFEIVRWVTVDIYQSLGRVGVPLFVMLTGALLLQPSKNESISGFFKKRWARIGLPFIFWGAVYFAYDFFVLNHAITANAIVQGILTGPYYHFWYLYMLMGLYLLTPILRILVAHAENKILKYFTILWFLGASIIPFAGLLTTYHLDSNVLTITGMVGYFVLGAVLLTVKMRRSVVAMIMAIGIALTVIGTYALAATVGGGTMFFFQEYLSPTMILASVMLFLLLITL